MCLERRSVNGTDPPGRRTTANDAIETPRTDDNTTSMRFTRYSWLIALSVAVGHAAAQGATTAAGPASVRKSMLAINPMGIPWDVFQVEFETGVARGGTVGVTGSYTDLNAERNTSIDLKVRFYPAEELFNRISAGLSVGYTKFDREVCCGSPPDFVTTRETLSAPTLGVVIDYNWLQGSSRRFLLGTGVGAKRILASRSERDRLQLERAYPTARFVVGVVF
jgi:hypothetical protein